MKKVFLSVITLMAIALFGCGGGGGSSADDVFKPGPAPSAVVMVPASNAIIPGEQTAITVSLFDLSGQLIKDKKNVSFALSDPALGSIAPLVTVTDGVAVVPFQAKTAEGTAKITGTVDGVSGECEILIANPGAHTIRVSASSSTIRPGSTAEITVTLFDASGQLVTGAKSVELILSSPHLGSIPSPITVTGGFATRTFTARSSEGSVDITAKVDGAQDTLGIQISNQKAASSIELTPNPATISLGGTSVVSATVRDNDGVPLRGTIVNFSVDNPTVGNFANVTAVTNSLGVAEATFQAGTATAGPVVVSAVSGSASATANLEVTAAAAGSIVFVSAEPQIISIQGAGGIETSKISFLVQDINGNPAVGSQTVRLTLSGPNGGEYLGATPGIKTLQVGTVNGIASTYLHSGNIPGTVTVTALIVGTTLSTSSGVIAIGGGTPSAKQFSLSLSTLNIEGFAYDNVQTDVIALLADRYGNYNVLEGTTVSFYSECGAVDRAVALDDIGQGKVIFRTQDPRPQDVVPGTCGPRCDEENAFISEFESKFGVDIPAVDGRNPRDGLCTIIAVVDGEEAFEDANGNGQRDAGETLYDSYDDIHLDKDDDPTTISPISAGRPFDASFEHLIVDRNKNGVFNGTNGVWDSSKRIAKPINILFTGTPMLSLSSTDLYIPDGGSRTINFAVHDANFNRPISGTTIKVTAEGGVKLTGTLEYTYMDSNALGTPIFSVTLSDANPGTDPPKAELFSVVFEWTWLGSKSTYSLTGTSN